MEKPQYYPGTPQHILDKEYALAHPPTPRASERSVSNNESLLLGASPRPWKGIIGRSVPMRIDIMDANNKLVCHFHPTSPATEMTENWENNAALILETINKL